MKNVISPLLMLASFAAAATAARAEECVTPPKFSGPSSPGTVYVTMKLTTGDFFSQLMNGMKQQAALVGDSGVKLTILDADNNETKLAEDIMSATQDETTIGIVTVDGDEDLCGAINSAIKKGIAVVSFDFDGDACNEKQVKTSQMDEEMARLVLTNAADTLGKGLNVGYVNDLNFAPLQKRNEVWEAFKKAYNWNQVFFVQNASQYATQADLQAAIETSIEETSNVSFTYAPWDHLAQTTVSAVKETDGSIDVYGADINDQDIAVMRNSTWRATAGGDPMYIGASLTRMVVKTVVGQLTGIGSNPFLFALGNELSIPSVLVTQDFLLAEDVTNMNELNNKLPAMRLPDFVTACWIRPIGGQTDVPPTTTTTPAGNAPPPTPPGNVLPPTPDAISPTATAPSSGNVARLLTAPICVVWVMVYFFV